jgi:hypothetical protein
MIGELCRAYPLEDEGFDENGEVTEAAAVRMMTDVFEMLPEKARQALRTHTLEEQMNAAMNELAAIGALERVPSNTGMPTHRKVRDWSNEESERAWAREAQTETEDAERGGHTRKRENEGRCSETPIHSATAKSHGTSLPGPDPTCRKRTSHRTRRPAPLTQDEP